MPMVEVLDPADNRLVAGSPAVATGTNDWQEFTVDFKAPEDSEGFVVRIARGFCGDACPIVGLLWLDDFTLVKR